MASTSSVVTIGAIGEAAPGIDCSVAALPANARVDVCARCAMSINKQAAAVANVDTRRDDRNRSRRGHEPSGTPHGATGQTGCCNQGDDAGEHQEALGGLLMAVQGRSTNHVLDAVLLVLTSLERHPGTQCQRG